jgi:hypothetical protein
MGYNVNIINSENTVTTTVIEYPVNVSVDDLTFNVNTTEVNVGVTNVDTTVTLYTNAIELLVDDFNNYFMGDWVSGQTYRRGQLVDYANSLFVCSTGTLTSVTTTVNPAISPVYQWRRVVWHEAPFANLRVTGVSTFTGMTYLVGGTDIQTALDHLTVTNHLSAGSLSVGAVSGSGLNVQGNMYLSGTSTFASTATFLNDIVIGGGVGGNGLRINGPAVFNGTATFNAAVNMSTASLVVGNLTAAGVLYPQDAGAFGQVLYTNGVNQADWINLGELVLWSLASDLTTNGFDIVTGYTGNQANNPRLRIGSGNDTNLAAYIDFPTGGQSIIFTATTVNTVAGSGGINLTSADDINITASTANSGDVNVGGRHIRLQSGSGANVASIIIDSNYSTIGGYAYDTTFDSQYSANIVDPSTNTPAAPPGGYPEFNINRYDIDVTSSFLQANNIGISGQIRFGDGTTQNTAGGGGYVGSVGYTGSSGARGFTGSAGTNGGNGSTGFTGSKGDIGFTGSQGLPGDVGNLGYTGSQGAAGYVGSTGFTGSFGYTGSIGIDWKSVYSNSVTYYKGDAVFYNGSSYRHKDTAGTVGLNPADYPVYWELLAQQGDIGFTGSVGADGPPGGYTGSRGYNGSNGFTGSQGYTGSTGPMSNLTTVSLGADMYTNGYAIRFSTSTSSSIVLELTAAKIGNDVENSQLNVQKIYNYAGTNAPQFPAGVQYPDSTIQVTAFTTQTLGLYLIDFGVI